MSKKDTGAGLTDLAFSKQLQNLKILEPEQQRILFALKTGTIEFSAPN